MGWMTSLKRSSIIYQISKSLSSVKLPIAQVKADDNFIRSCLLNNDGKCEYCENQSAETMDHFRPLVIKSAPSGYCNDAWNLIPACYQCNSSKGNRFFQDWLMSDAKLNPVRSNPELRAKILTKFHIYDKIFEKRHQKVVVDPTWFKSVEHDVKLFLEGLQTKLQAQQKIIAISNSFDVAEEVPKRSSTKKGTRTTAVPIKTTTTIPAKSRNRVQIKIPSTRRVAVPIVVPSTPKSPDKEQVSSSGQRPGTRSNPHIVQMVTRSRVAST